MKQHFGFALGLVLSVAAIPAMAAAPGPVDVTGTWSVKGDVQGVEVSETCMLTQSADLKITGTCTSSAGGGKYDTTGAVKGNDVVFIHAGDYQGDKLTLTYTGKVGTDGAMSGTIDVDPFSVTGSFSATKTAAVAAQ